LHASYLCVTLGKLHPGAENQLSLADQHLFLDQNSPIERLVREVRQLPEAEQFAAVERLFVDADPGIRCRAMRVAQRLGHPRIVEFCTWLFADPVWYVRCAACEAASYLAPLSVPAEPLLRLVEFDENETVRFYAALALEQAADGRHVPEMARLVEVVTGTNHEGVTVKDRLFGSMIAAQKRGTIPQVGSADEPTVFTRQ
jgi:hypothetical protein